MRTTKLSEEDNARIVDLERQMFELKNPPKFAIGDMVKVDPSILKEPDGELSKVRLTVAGYRKRLERSSVNGRFFRMIYLSNDTLYLTEGDEKLYIKAE